MARPTAADTLLKNRLIRFGVPAAEADWIIGHNSIRHQWGPKKRDVEYLQLVWIRDQLHGLALAEHIARVCANWSRCYHVSASQLAMAAR